LSGAGDSLFPAPRSRALAATLGAFVVSVLVTTAMPRVLPLSEANSIVLPIVLFPLTWLALFFWVCFDRNMWRTWVGLALLGAGSAGLIARSLGVL